MKAIPSIIMLIATVLILGSCEGPKNFAVTVMDKGTQQPLDSVLVFVKVKRGEHGTSSEFLQGYTDATGKFMREEMIGTGLSMKRWYFYMEYSKNGYMPKTELDRTEGLVEMEHHSQD